MKAPVLASLLLLSALRVHAAALEVPLVVEEPAGVAQPHARVTSGVPVPDDAADTHWALFDGARELPLQVTPLTMTRPRWILLDFTCALRARASPFSLPVDRHENRAPDENRRPRPRYPLSSGLFLLARATLFSLSARSSMYNKK